jgi:hypothetical protein
VADVVHQTAILSEPVEMMSLSGLTCASKFSGHLINSELAMAGILHVILCYIMLYYVIWSMLNPFPNITFPCAPK